MNVFLTRDGQVKLGDLGVSRLMEDVGDGRAAEMSRVGTPMYFAPELVKREAYDYRVDVWSLGCLVYTICQLAPPFRADNIYALAVDIVKKPPRPLPRMYSPKLRHLISRMLEKDPQKRPTVQALVGMFPLHMRQQMMLLDEASSGGGAGGGRGQSGGRGSNNTASTSTDDDDRDRWGASTTSSTVSTISMSVPTQHHVSPAPRPAAASRAWSSAHGPPQQQSQPSALLRSGIYVGTGGSMLPSGIGSQLVGSFGRSGGRAGIADDRGVHGRRVTDALTSSVNRAGPSAASSSASSVVAARRRPGSAAASGRRRYGGVGGVGAEGDRGGDGGSGRRGYAATARRSDGTAASSHRTRGQQQRRRTGALSIQGSNGVSLRRRPASAAQRRRIRPSSSGGGGGGGGGSGGGGAVAPAHTGYSEARAGRGGSRHRSRGAPSAAVAAVAAAAATAIGPSRVSQQRPSSAPRRRRGREFGAAMGAAVMQEVDRKSTAVGSAGGHRVRPQSAHPGSRRHHNYPVAGDAMAAGGAARAIVVRQWHPALMKSRRSRRPGR